MPDISHLYPFRSSFSAGVVELVDTYVSGAYVARHESSSLFACTIFILFFKNHIVKLGFGAFLIFEKKKKNDYSPSRAAAGVVPLGATSVCAIIKIYFYDC